MCLIFVCSLLSLKVNIATNVVNINDTIDIISFSSIPFTLPKSNASSVVIGFEKKALDVHDPNSKNTGEGIPVLKC